MRVLFLLFVVFASGCASWAEGEVFRVNPDMAYFCEAGNGCLLTTNRGIEAFGIFMYTEGQKGQQKQKWE